jgi:osmotically-inducible protein OsmY
MSAELDSTKYLVARVHEALAMDDRTNALDVQVLFSGGKIYILGQVSSAERRRAAEEVAREVLPSNTKLVNELWVQTFSEPTEPETVG